METLVSQLAQAVGTDGVLTGESLRERSYSLWTHTGEPVALVRPRSTEQVAEVLKAAAAAGRPVVPWGGLTGLVRGAYAQDAIALSLDRMNAVEAIDTASGTMTVQAGCVLEAAADAAKAQGLFLPLDLGSRGSATIGGVISTNAGGNRALRFGMMRDMVLGLEVVLANGVVLSSMNRMIKNNTGYDLKQLFIGSEGTLGVVTRANLRLRAWPEEQHVALVAVETFGALPALLRRLEADLPSLSAFEVMWADFYQLVTTPPANGKPVLPHGHAYYVLIETLGARGAREALEVVLDGAMSDGLVADAVLAKSQGERDRIWALRDDVAQTARRGPIVTFDVSLPIPAMEDYVASVRTRLAALSPAADAVVFGHLADGNLHLVVGRPAQIESAQIEDCVYAPLAAHDGSISAEHGIGLVKKDHLHLSRTSEELGVMRLLKQALDPRGVLNPGKIFDVASAEAR